jgi:hypothetical protein
MDATDELDVRGYVRQDAAASIGAVAEHEDLIAGEPPGRQLDELQG